MTARRSVALSLLPLLAACAAPQGAAPSRPAAGTPLPQQPQVQTNTAFRAPRVMNAPGLEGVIGAEATGLVRQFGTPRLDVWENDARKLQFSGTACTLDVFLYPLTPGARETATWVEARRTDGRDVDRAACVAALRR